MIRINLLGQSRPKAQRRAVPLEATLQLLFLALALALGLGFLGIDYWQLSNKAKDVQKDIDQKKQQKAQLEQIKQQVDAFEKQKNLLQQRINVIEDLQRNRAGGQELLDAVANTVSRTETLWLTSLSRKGDSLTIVGTAGSINAIAEYIAQLKRSGYFAQVEIKEAKQNENPDVQLFDFTLNAQFAPPGSKPAAPAPPAPQAPARKG
ncbi:MAG TPA: PilN domain-containing protein [Candidatus Acidoferrales bacterium]|jgi:type IV pilus assembly protein PilN|nr:PilN domain-containing protein [Candidatus Acidoferrales bacterium]